MSYSDTEVIYLLILILSLILIFTIYYILLIIKRKIKIKEAVVSWVKKIIYIIFAGW